MLIVAQLTVLASEIESFRAYEHAAAKIMARYGGRIEQVLVLDHLDLSRSNPALAVMPERFDQEATLDLEGTDEARIVDTNAALRELHVVRFPSTDAFDAYRQDPELGSLRGQRERCVLATEIWSASAGPRYGD